MTCGICPKVTSTVMVIANNLVKVHFYSHGYSKFGSGPGGGGGGGGGNTGPAYASRKETHANVLPYA